VGIREFEFRMQAEGGKDARQREGVCDEGTGGREARERERWRRENSKTKNAPCTCPPTDRAPSPRP
jgi:hypothetical protein